MIKDADRLWLASVIIPAHDAESTIGRQLAALSVQVNAPPFEVIVVANRCTDDTFSVAESYSDQLSLKIIRADEIPSAAYARNVGASCARGEYLLFCDADDVVSEEWVSGMLEPLLMRTADFVGSAAVLDTSRLPEWILRWRYSDWANLRCFSDDLLPYAKSASLAVRRSSFEEVSGFDTAFGRAGGEEVDFQRRLFRAGKRAGCAPRAFIQYSPKVSFKDVLLQASNYWQGWLIACWIETGKLPSASVFRALALTVWKWLQLVRRGVFHPRILLAVPALEFAKWQARRKFVPPQTRNRYAPENFGVDACVHLEAPIIGGLAFAVSSHSEALALRRLQGCRAGTLSLLDRMLPAGGQLLDLSKSQGVLSVAAALRVGPTGHVISIESNNIREKLLKVNIARHNVGNQVDIPDGSSAPLPADTFYKGSLLDGSWFKKTDVVLIDFVHKSHLKLDEIERLMRFDSKTSIIIRFSFRRSLFGRSRLPEIFGAFPQAEWSWWVVDEFTSQSLHSVRANDGALLERKISSPVTFLVKRSQYGK